jgi:ubiquinone/menaquinone biosynthesis C-methylase UbiE
MNSFKDLFSTQASDYSKFRPHYPEELFVWLASQVSEKKAVWDCGTGNGQAAVQWSRYFERVYATDPSSSQIAKAIASENISYRVGSAEASGLQPASVNLTSVAQAYHWFDHTKFFEEVRRVSKPGAIVAVWSYDLAKITPEVDAAVYELYEDILASYWEPERKSVEQGYKNLPFDFQRIETPSFSMKSSWSFEHLMGYLGTWSALQAYLKKNQRDPRELIFEKARLAWASVDGERTERPVSWNLSLHVGRVSA